ncbi:hypothetical protein EVAR_30975_1 [Eumeta japonica]|uniref:Uncharacterized protein n=1 Tax=Eumeta variegata TaxID=151549 RepID=A0A4C1W7E3_EUMVA|nr:hypothetical protein EVAR_30975_1 [Eumeta japonica]
MPHMPSTPRPDTNKYMQRITGPGMVTNWRTSKAYGPIRDRGPYSDLIQLFPVDTLQPVSIGFYKNVDDSSTWRFFRV